MSAYGERMDDKNICIKGSVLDRRLNHTLLAQRKNSSMNIQFTSGHWLCPVPQILIDSQR